MVDISLSFDGVVHRGTLVDKHLTTQIGFCVELLDKQFVGTAVEVPVDVTGTLASIVLPIVGELD